MELLFSPKNFAAVRVFLTKAWWLKTKTGHIVPAGYQRALRTLHGQLLLGELGAKWGKQDHYLVILMGFSERILHFTELCMAFPGPQWDPVGFGTKEVTLSVAITVYHTDHFLVTDLPHGRGCSLWQYLSWHTAFIIQVNLWPPSLTTAASEKGLKSRAFKEGRQDLWLKPFSVD